MLKSRRTSSAPSCDALYVSLFSTSGPPYKMNPVVRAARKHLHRCARGYDTHRPGGNQVISTALPHTASVFLAAGQLFTESSRALIALCSCVTCHYALCGLICWSLMIRSLTSGLELHAHGGGVVVPSSVPFLSRRCTDYYCFIIQTRTNAHTHTHTSIFTPFVVKTCIYKKVNYSTL